MTNAKNELTSNVKAAASDVAETTMAKLNDSSRKAQDKIADRAETEARNVAEAGAAFEDNPYARQAAEKVSETLTQVAEAVRSADLGTLQRDVTNFARSNPAVFFGGAAVLGFLAARAMKASERADIDADYTGDYTPGRTYDAHAFPAGHDQGWGRS